MSLKIIFKHSPICPISTRARQEVEQCLKAWHLTMEVEWIDVIANRPRSNEVAEQLGIRHESPQIIILDNGDNVMWHASHGQITQQKLKEILHS
jgi:bacillithiol system protein YtxJ